MSERTDYIITPWEIEIHVQDLQPSNIEDIGTKTYVIPYNIGKNSPIQILSETFSIIKFYGDFRWLEFHKKILLLNQQSVLEISTLREEAVKEWFISLKKVYIQNFTIILITESFFSVHMRITNANIYNSLNILNEKFDRYNIINVE